MGTGKKPARRAEAWQEVAPESCPCGTAAESEPFALAPRPAGVGGGLDRGRPYVELIRAEEWLHAAGKGT